MSMNTRMTIEDKGWSLEELYELFKEAIEAAERLRALWAERAAPACENAINVLRDFAEGQATTDEVKAQFKAMTTLCHEVVMDDTETKAVLCLAEVAHAAAHLGHLATSMSHVGEANREYDSLQRAYVLFGLEGAKRYATDLLSAAKNAPAWRHDC